MGKKKSGSGSGMNNPDHNSESLETNFCVKILKFFDVDLGSGMKKKSDPGWKIFRSRKIVHTQLEILKTSAAFSKM
jgi:hypothetical protein